MALISPYPQAARLQIIGQAGFHGHLVRIAAQGVNKYFLQIFKAHGLYLVLFI